MNHFRTCPILMASLLLVIMGLGPVSAQELFSDSFESGGIEAWSRSAGADCEMLASEAPDCDFDQGLGNWSIPPSGGISAVSEDSDGDTSSGSIEMVFSPSNSASTGLCYPRNAQDEVVLTFAFDFRIVSGTITNCSGSISKFSDSDCVDQVGSLQGPFFPESETWHRIEKGRTLTSKDVQSVRLILHCSGDGVARIDDMVVTPMAIQN